MALHEVRELVSRKFGKKVSSHYDVLQLQEAIVAECGKRISSQTIKRFFGLIKSDSKPDPATLDTLAAYLHFSSYNDLENWRQVAKTNGQETHADQWAGEIVLQIIKDIKPEHLHEKGLMQIIKNLFILIERHPELPSIIYPRLAASEFGRRYFFDQFIHYDALAFHYGNGLEHYLMYETSREHRVLAYNQLVLRGFLTGNFEACRYYFTKLSSFSTVEIERFHPFIVGRYYATKLYMNAIEGDNVVEYVNEQLEKLLEVDRPAHDHFNGYPCAEVVFGEALILTGHFKHAYQLLNKKRIRHYNHPPSVDPAHKTHLEVLRLVGAVFSDSLTEDKIDGELQWIQGLPVYFLGVNYINWLVHLVKLKAGKNPRQNFKKVHDYISHLGFIMPPAFTGILNYR
ncbi:hypothetical protein [Aridibaculum aurantiacum]|uniref:hypothetical protein n=1 Tax=Aridibaculum aurantiacum TaxID=2810307 RepID=UPI001A962FD0|nr:hypothetical protein [Aridibaculum aurantiacum]